MFYGTGDCENMSRVISRNDIIVQNCSVVLCEKADVIFTIRIKKTVTN
jgi:hypothetical protein